MGSGNTVSALALMALLATVVTSLAAQVTQDEKSPKSQAPTVTSANDGIFAAFQTHPLVGIGDHHGMAQEEDFFASLIRDKRFATEVGNVVVEFGDAAQQGTSLTQSPIAPDLYLDADFRKKIDRRAFMMNGQHLTWPAARDNPVSPSYLHSYGDAGRDPK